jgi:hypothetical protein
VERSDGAKSWAALLGFKKNEANRLFGRLVDGWRYWGGHGCVCRLVGFGKKEKRLYRLENLVEGSVKKKKKWRRYRD